MVRRRRLATRYTNRSLAGRLLGEALAAETVIDRPIVLALPRGGVPVAAEVAAQLNAPLGVILVRKIGVPGRSELAMGALAMVDGQLSEFRNDEIVDGLGISRQTFDAARDRERLELERRASVFSSKNLNVAGATVIVVDDGLATGAWLPSLRSAVWSLPPLSSPYLSERAKQYKHCGRLQIWWSASPPRSRLSRWAPPTRISGSSATRRSS